MNRLDKISDYVRVEKGLNAVTFYLTYASPDELSEIIGIDKVRKSEIEKLQFKLYPPSGLFCVPIHLRQHLRLLHWLQGYDILKKRKNI